MLQFLSKEITEKSPWADFFDREKRANGWAYRPKTAVAPPIAPDLDLAAVEGDPRLFFHIRRERDAALARAKREAMHRPDGSLMCEACGFLAARVYPGLSGDVCEVHHRLPLSKVTDKVATRLEDLALLCPNCHRAIHRTDPLKSVEDFRTAFFSKQGS
jgi:5-methylcytosine-specific restriction protein A